MYSWKFSQLPIKGVMNVKPNAYNIFLWSIHTKFNNKALAHCSSNAQRMAYTVIRDWYLPFDRTLAHQWYTCTMSREPTYCCHSAAILSQSSTIALSLNVYTQYLKQSQLLFLVSFKSSPGSEEGSNSWKIMPALDFNRVYTFIAFSCVLLCQKIVECDRFITVYLTTSFLAIYSWLQESSYCTQPIVELVVPTVSH